MQGVSIDSSHLLHVTRIVRERLDELIERGSLIQPQELHYLRQYVHRSEVHYGQISSR